MLNLNTPLGLATLGQGVGGIINSIFADGTDGFYYDFSNLAKLWKDTAATTPVAVAGDSIARVDDSSPRGKNLIQAVGTIQPKWQTGGIARFDGVDDFSRVTTYIPGGATGSTLMVKGLVTSAPAASKYFLGLQKTGPTDRFRIGINAAGELVGALGTAVETTIRRIGSVLGTPFTAALTCDGSTTTLYFNGNVAYSGAQAGAPSATVSMYLGGQNADGTAADYLAADHYRELGIRKSLTAAEIIAITNLWG